MPSLWEPGSPATCGWPYNSLSQLWSCQEGGKTGIRSSRWMTSAKANKSVGVWFIVQACQSGQHESDPRPQGASDGWKMRVSDPAHGPAHHPHLCPLPRSTPTCPWGRQNSISLTGASGRGGGVPQASTHPSKAATLSVPLMAEKMDTHSHTCTQL